MRFLRKNGLLMFFVGSFLFAGTSCKTGEGCDNEIKYSVKTDKNGDLSTKRGKSNLFSKKQRKKMRK